VHLDNFFNSKEREIVNILSRRIVNRLKKIVQHKFLSKFSSSQ